MSNHTPIIVIVGPTASAKSAIAAKVARNADGEIISADSRQVYRYLDIGTNKSGKLNHTSGLWEIDGIPQHLIDCIDPAQTFSAGDFISRTTTLIEEIRTRGMRPIIVGGTGLYIKTLIDGLAQLPAPDPKLREQLKKECSAHGKEYLYQRLKSLDPDSAEKHRYNPQRLIRAIEVCTLSGKPISMLHADTTPSKENFIQFGLRWPRTELYANINLRTRAMIDAGLIDEATAAIKRGYAPDCPGLASIGYGDALACAKGEISRQQLEEKISRDTRHYAKRQITWFNRDKRITWIDTTQSTFDPPKIANAIVAKRN